MSLESAADRQLVVSRTIGAPRELVFRMFTEAEHVAHWWGPAGYTITSLQIDIRVGGQWRFVMHGPDGTDWPNRIVYTEIIPPEKLCYGHDGDVDNDPGKFDVQITFMEVDGGTHVSMQLLMPTVEFAEQAKAFGAVELGQSTLQCLDEYLQQNEGKL